MLERLIRGLPIAAPPSSLAGSADLGRVEVRGVQHDSRRIETGDLFVAVVGRRHDGRAYVGEAARRGAVAVIAPGPAPADSPLPWLETASTRALLGPLAARLYDHPDRELDLVGVTGTNGKSTVVALVTTLLESTGRPTGSIGTLGYRLGERTFGDGRYTTPEASDFFRLLREMRDAGADAVAMEVSSHALAQERVAGATFDLAVFTNLTRDHLDFHADFEDYFAAKRRLFDLLAPGGAAVVNLEDPYGARLAGELRQAGKRVIAFGAGGDVAVRAAELGPTATRGRLATPRGELAFVTPLLGRYNLSNLMAAVGVAEALELPHAAIGEALAGQQPVAGRLEPVDRGQPFPVYVDYAHTPAALEATLAAVAELVPGRLIAVFGCGGDRDPGKRPQMGEISGRLAGYTILTSDNPRSEDPLAILADIEAGLAASGSASYEIVPDRRRAIERAIELADAESAVLVAGKGHEATQTVGDRVIPFFDRDEVIRALEVRFGHPADG